MGKTHLNGILLVGRWWPAGMPTVNSEIFARILFCDAKNSRQGHDLSILVNDRVNSAFREDFIFTKFRENKTLAKISKFTVFFIRISRFHTNIRAALRWLYASHE